MRVLVLVALSCWRFYAFGEIWICLVFVLFVLHSLPALHVVGVAFADSLIRLRLLLFIDDLALFYWPRAQQSVAQVCLAGLSWAR
jgi:hypothetical protein